MGEEPPVIDRDDAIDSRMAVQHRGEAMRGHHGDLGMRRHAAKALEQRSDEHQVPEPAILAHDEHTLQRFEPAVRCRAQRRTEEAPDQSDAASLEPMLADLPDAQGAWPPSQHPGKRPSPSRGGQALWHVSRPVTTRAPGERRRAVVASIAGIR